MAVAIVKGDKAARSFFGAGGCQCVSGIFIED